MGVILADTGYVIVTAYDSAGNTSGLEQSITLGNVGSGAYEFKALIRSSRSGAVLRVRQYSEGNEVLNTYSKYYRGTYYFKDTFIRGTLLDRTYRVEVSVRGVGSEEGTLEPVPSLYMFTGVEFRVDGGQNMIVNPNMYPTVAPWYASGIGVSYDTAVIGSPANGDKTIVFPDKAFVFNPTKAYFTVPGDSRNRLRLNLSRSDGKRSANVERDPRITPASSGAIFELSGVLQEMFIEGFNNTDMPRVLNPDTDFYQVVNITAYEYVNDSWQQLGSSSTFRAVWGAAQLGTPGEGIKLYTNLTYWRGLPFTVPYLFFNERETVTWYSREDRGGYTERGTLAPGKYNLPEDSATAEHEIVYRMGDASPEWPGAFDRTFDHTFRGVLGDTFITLDVCTCVNEGHVYLRWLGRQGEWFYYNFKIINTSYTTADVTPAIEARYDSPYNEDFYYDHPGSGPPIGKDEQETLTLSAPLLDSEHYEYVKQIIGSPYVLMLVENRGSVNASYWVRCNVQPGSFSRTNEPLQDFSINLLKPKTILQHG